MRNRKTYPTIPRTLWFIIAAAVALLLLISPAQPVAASCGGATIVSTEAELDSAISNFNATSTGPCIFTILLGADINLTASTRTINNTRPNISLVIEGNGKTVNGQGTAGSRPFTLNGGTVTINQITITGGNVTLAAGSGTTGGGITNQGGSLTVTNSTITGNQSEGGGGGISNCEFCTLTVQNSTISGNTAGTVGGGIRASGTTTIDSSTLVNNVAGDGSNLWVSLGATATVRNSILANSVSGNDCGRETLGEGGTLIDGGHNLVETPGNCAASLTGPGTILNQDPALGPLANNGGPTQTHLPQAGSPAINAGDTTLTTDQRGVARPFGAADDIGAVEVEATCPAFPVSVANEGELNDAIGCFNAITTTGVYTINVTQNISLTNNITRINNPTVGVDLVIVGGNHTIDGGFTTTTPGNEGFSIRSLTAVTMSDLTVSRCQTLLTGAAIHNVGGGALTLNNVTLTYNTAGFGGAGLNTTGPVTITNSLIAHNLNDGTGGGGGILVESPGSVTLIDSEVADNISVARGGGIRVRPGASLTVIGSTIARNDADVAGGGIFNEGTLTMQNSTVSGNTASTSSGLGGAVYISSGSGTLDSVTVANNSTPNNPLGVSGVVFAAGTTGSMNNTIAYAPGFATDFYCVGSATVTFNRNLFGVVADAGIGSSCDAQTGNIVGQAPSLGPLANNGGSTQTHLPNPDSPTIDAGDTTLAVDQRGISRPQGAADDIGAVEVENPCTGNTNVGTEAELNAAIACYNQQTAPGVYTINLTQDILLTASTTTINNANTGLELQILGAGHTVNGQNIAGVRPFTVAADTVVKIGSITITGGNAGSSGSGGGIDNAGTLTVYNGTIASNRAEQGGGIANIGILTIEDSTIANNQQLAGATGQAAGILSQSGTLTIKNSTVSGNQAVGSAIGPGAIAIFTGSATFDSVTVVNNVVNNARGLIGGVFVGPATTVTMVNTIVSDNSGPGDRDNLGCSPIADSVAITHSLIQSADAACNVTNGVAGNIVGVSANLGPLADNGGPTQTHLPNTGSPAINAGDTTLTFDQRGIARPQGVADDIGAVEVCAPPAAPAVGIAISGTQVQLSWTGTADVFDVFRSSNQPYFTPTAPPYAGDVSSPWLDPDTSSIGDVANNYFYVVRTTNACGESADSNRVGEFDYTLVPGTP